jgi:hypothetical protein
MKLEGSCHCGAVRFTVDAKVPVPYARCYCSICRKTAGGGGYAINLDARRASMGVTGGANVSVYRARRPDPKRERSSLRRYFCKRCGSALWAAEPDSAWVHPFASAIDTPMPKPRAHMSIMLDFAPSWVRVPAGRNDLRAGVYSERSYEVWARKHGYWED